MTSRTLTEKQVSALDFQVEQLYSTFKRAVETGSHQDAVWSQESFAAFGKSLLAATNTSAISDWRRDTKRAGVFDKYILSYKLGYISSLNLKELTKSRELGIKTIAKETPSATRNLYPVHLYPVQAIGDLVQAIENPKTPYWRIETIARTLTEAHNFTTILIALGYVREKYQK